MRLGIARLEHMTTEFTWREVIDRHLALLASTLVFAFVVARILFVAQMNGPTALAIVSTSGAVEVALGIIVSSYWAFVLLGLLVADARRRIARRRKRSTRQAVVAESIFGFMAVAFVGWRLTVVYVGLMVLFGWMDRYLEDKRNVKPDPWTGSGTAAGTLFLSVFVVGSIMWLPAEVITTTDSSRPAMIGYVLDTSDGWTSVLEDMDRTVERLRSESILARTICSPLDAQFNRSIAQIIFFDEPPVERCGAVVDRAQSD